VRYPKTSFYHNVIIITMKKILVIVLLSVFTIHIQAQNQAKRYIVKSGKIEMNLTGSTVGTKTIYFDDYGNKYYEHEESVSEVRMLGISSRTVNNKITIYDGPNFWSIDNESHKNIKGKLPFFKEYQDVYGDMSTSEQENYNKEILRSFGGEKVGTDIILGKTCDKISIMGSYTWLYKGISLKLNTNVMGIIANEEAVKFQENISIPASRFQAPQNLRYEDIDAQMAMYNGMEQYDDYEDSEEDDIVAVTYPFADFQAAMNNFKPEGYARMMVMNEGGQYVALYTIGFSNIISVMATSEKNMEGDADMELSGFETIQHGGKTLRYGDISEDDMDGKALIIPYKAHDMYIILLTSPGKDKASILKLADKLEF